MLPLLLEDDSSPGCLLRMPPTHASRCTWVPLPLESPAWPAQAGLGGPSLGSHCALSYLLYHGIAIVSLCLPKTGISWRAGVVLFLTKPGKSFQAFCTDRIF